MVQMRWVVCAAIGGVVVAILVDVMQRRKED